MKKQRQKKRPHRKKQAAAQTVPAAAEAPDRRATLIKLRNWGIVAGVLGVGGYFSVQSVQATIAEHDLTRIGNGTPAVVQIHDPNCLLCRSLQKETRAALRRFEDDAVQYVIANIQTTEGRSFAARHGVPHVTLLLFDGRGEVRQVIQGTQDRDDLETSFAETLRLR